MAAQGNQTTYKRAEGESTQWEDIQRKLGNLPAKEPVEVRLLTKFRTIDTHYHLRVHAHRRVLQKPKPFAPAREPDKVRDLIEATGEDELEDLEDDFTDDKFLEEYRQVTCL